MYKTPLDLTSQFYRPLVNIWIERLSAARTAKARFTKVSEQCTEFYEAGAGFMWEEKFKRDYFAGKLPSPKFKITIAKLYEFVAIYGPHLFWQYARRKVINQRQMRLRPEMFGDPNDPTVQQVYAQVLQQDTIEQAMSSFANEMMGNYLDWSQREQPHGGLAINGQLAVTEALVKGMGCLWPDVYSFPGSQQKFTRLRYKTVNNLFVDPDCKDPMLETAGYIALRHVNPIWQIEKKFNLPKGTLAGKGNISSMEQVGRNNQKKQPGESAKGTHDQIEWWEIWSKCGVGPRAASMSHQMIDEFDDSVGDYAYLCIANGVPFPLNAPPDKFFGENSASIEDVKSMFEWRYADYGEQFPCWKDGRWPVSLLSFNKLPNTPWPLAPAAPGLGELIALNILTSTYVDQAWADRKQLIGYLKSALGDVKQALESENSVEVVAINDNVQRSIADTIQYLNTPGRANNLLDAIAMLSQNFDKRVGLSELQYGMSSTQIRVASDIRSRTESANIRPDKMSKDVAAWMSDAAQMEMFSAILYVDGMSLTHLLGGYGASQWDTLIKGMPIEQAMREMKATVEASEIRRPNHERDTANMQSLQQYITPLLMQYAQQTSNSEPLKEFFVTIGEAIESPSMAKIAGMIGPWQPPADEQSQQLMQAAQQAEVENVQSDSAQKQAAAKKLEAEAVATIAEMGAEPGEGEGENAAANKANEVAIDEVKFRQSLQHKQQEHEQKMISNQELLVQKLLFNEAEASLKQQVMKEQGAIQNAQAKRRSAFSKSRT